MQLAVVIASLKEHNAPLAYGNIIGSCISNILGAFSLGLLFGDFYDAPLRHQGAIALPVADDGDGREDGERGVGVLRFEKSAKICAIAQFVLTLIAVSLLSTSPYPTSPPSFDGSTPRIAHGSGTKIKGIILLVLFGVYISAATFAIYKGVLDPPEGSSDSSSSSDSSEDTSDQLDGRQAAPHPSLLTRLRLLRLTLLPSLFTLLLSFLALSLSGYILSHSASSLASSFNLSQTTFGLTVLSLTTTLPEKFFAVVAGRKGKAEVLVSSAAGSNMFLLTLCAGVTLLASAPSLLEEGQLREGGRAGGEQWQVFAWTVFSSFSLLLVVLLGARRWHGAAMLILYVIFLCMQLR